MRIQSRGSERFGEYPFIVITPMSTAIWNGGVYWGPIDESNRTGQPGTKDYYYNYNYNYYYYHLKPYSSVQIIQTT